MVGQGILFKFLDPVYTSWGKYQLCELFWILIHQTTKF